MKRCSRAGKGWAGCVCPRNPALVHSGHTLSKSKGLLVSVPVGWPVLPELPSPVLGSHGWHHETRQSWKTKRTRVTGVGGCFRGPAGRSSPLWVPQVPSLSGECWELPCHLPIRTAPGKRHLRDAFTLGVLTGGWRSYSPPPLPSGSLRSFPKLCTSIF